MLIEIAIGDAYGAGFEYMGQDRMSTLLKACIGFGGDVDTVAAIALGAASSCDEIQQDLPSHLHDTLENGTFGREYLTKLDEKLLAMVVDDPQVRQHLGMALP